MSVALAPYGGANALRAPTCSCCADLRTACSTYGGSTRVDPHKAIRHECSTPNDDLFVNWKRLHLSSNVSPQPTHTTTMLGLWQGNASEPDGLERVDTRTANSPAAGPQADICLAKAAAADSPRSDLRQSERLSSQRISRGVALGFLYYAPI